MPTHYVLDQNFPWHVTGLTWPPSIQISRLVEVAPQLTRHVDDWEVLLGLDLLGGVDGFITNDASMLVLPTEMVALSRTRLALVVTGGVGHEPLRATGLVMVHLQQVTNTVDSMPKICLLRPGRVQPVTAWAQINRIATHRKVVVDQLVAEELAHMGLPRRPAR